MKDIFTENEFQFPYTKLRFPGQASDERILYVNREASVPLYLRLAFVVIAALVLTGVAVGVLNVLSNLIGGIASVLFPAALLLGMVFGGIGCGGYIPLGKKVYLLSSIDASLNLYMSPLGIVTICQLLWT